MSNKEDKKKQITIDLDEYTYMIRELERLKYEKENSIHNGRLQELQERYRILNNKYDDVLRDASNYEWRADDYKARIDKYNKKSFLYRMFNKV